MNKSTVAEYKERIAKSKNSKLQVVTQHRTTTNRQIARNIMKKEQGNNKIWLSWRQQQVDTKGEIAVMRDLHLRRNELFTKGV